MASSRVARIAMEVAPPQFVSVMRHRASQMLDPIKEEEREVTGNDFTPNTSRSSSSASSLTSSSSSPTNRTKSKYLFKEIKRSFPVFNLF